ncbi:MAG: phosphoheptose isomerase [Candidatus Saccharimonadales bacterium]
MSELPQIIKRLNLQGGDNYLELIEIIKTKITDAGYTIVEENRDKPWGAYFRINSSTADSFVNDFFSGLTPSDARLGIEDAELSPKFLIVKPGQRLSWQYHDRRAERWCFLTRGGYRKSSTDEESERFEAQPGEVVQFQKGERHRLEGREDGLVLVAEIWQHSDVVQPSDEDDIVRLADDYQR